MESSLFYQSRYDARNDILSPFTKNMTRLQRHYHKVTLDALDKRIKVWKQFENGMINVNKARIQNKKIENEIDELMEKKLKQLQEAKK